MSNWTYLRRTDGRDLLVDSDLVLGIWAEGWHTRIWTFAIPGHQPGFIDVKGSPRDVADALDFELPTLSDPEPDPKTRIEPRADWAP